MNNKQKTVLIISAVTVLLSGIYFPALKWIDVSSLRRGTSFWNSDLLAEWICIGIVTSILFFVLADNKYRKKYEEENSFHDEELSFGEEIHFSFKKCRAKYSAKPEQAGAEGKCKKCGERLLVPDISDFA